MKKIVIIGINCITAKYLPDALRGAGYEPTFILDIEAYSGASRQALETCRCYQADIEDIRSVLRLLRQTPEILRGAYAVTSFYDDKFPLIAHIARRWGLRCLEPAAVRLADKSEVMRLVPEYSPRGLVLRYGDLSHGAVSTFARSTRALVLKPALVSGGVGVTRPAPRDVSVASIRTAIATSGVPNALGQTWILQERVAGRLVSLEGFAVAGVPTFICFALRGRIGTTEVSDLLPADDWVAAAVRAHCQKGICTLINRSGFRNGYFHCEFVITADNAYLIDANMGRIGGATYAEQIALAHRFEPGEILRHATLLPLDAATAGPPPAFLPPEETRPTLGFFYGLEHGGTIRSIALPEQRSSMHTQFARLGSRVPPIGTSDASWVGLLAGLVDDAVRDIDRISIETDHGFAPPFYLAEE